MLLRWREQAERDLDELFDYLLVRNPRAALQTRDAILDRIGLLAEQPGLGRPGRVTSTRELVVARTPYVVAYTTDPRSDAVIILNASTKWWRLGKRDSQGRPQPGFIERAIAETRDRDPGEF